PHLARVRLRPGEPAAGGAGVRARPARCGRVGAVAVHRRAATAGRRAAAGPGGQPGLPLAGADRRLALAAAATGATRPRPAALGPGGPARRRGLACPALLLRHAAGDRARRLHRRRLPRRRAGVPHLSGLVVAHPGWAGTWLYVLQAVGVLLVWPWFLRLLVSLDRVMVRALLEPSPDRTRIAELQTSRALLAADAATVLSRLERDLHDGTQARLVSLGVTLGRIRHRVTDPEVRALVAGAQETVTDALGELRDIVRGIHPPALDAGLPTAVATLAARSPVPVETAVEVTDDGRGGATLDGGGTGLAG